jgi:hypothetical protein
LSKSLSATIDVDASPAEVWTVVSDLKRMSEWSPQCRACWWDEGGGPTVGSYFTGRNDDGKRTWETRSRVVAADPGREFSWVVNDGWVRWGFSLEPADGGTRLTEHWSFEPAGIEGFRGRFGEKADAQVAIRTTAAKEGIPVTLAAIKRTAEGG